VKAQSSVPLPIERRQSERFGVTYPAQIHIREGIPPRACTVLDISQGGGRIRLDTPGPVPDQFCLLFTASGTVRRTCTVVWRHEHYLGVAFSSRFDHALT
jgi:hypothetical protein